MGESVEVVKNGTCVIFEKDWQNALGSPMFYVWEIYGLLLLEVISKVYNEGGFQ